MLGFQGPSLEYMTLLNTVPIAIVRTDYRHRQMVFEKVVKSQFVNISTKIYNFPSVLRLNDLCDFVNYKLQNFFKSGS